MRRLALVAGTSTAALAWDPSAEASDAKRAIALFFAIICCAVAGTSNEGRGVGWKRWPRAWRFGLAFVVLSFVALAWGTTLGARDLGVWIAALVVGASAARLGAEGAKRVATTTAVIVGSVSSLHAIASWLGGARGLEVHGLQGNANWLGLVLAVTLPLTVDAASEQKSDKGARAGLVFAVLAQAMALWLSHARVAWVALAVATVFTIPWRSVLRTCRRSALVVVSLVALALSLGACRGARESAQASRDTPASIAVAGRWWIAKHGAYAALASFPLGAGLGRWTHVYLEAQSETLRAMPVREAARRFLDATTAHDDYVQAAVESGPLAALSLLLFLTAAAKGLRGRWRAGGAAVIAVGVSALGDDPMHRPAVVLLLALVVASVAPDDASAGRGRRWPWIAFALFCSVFLLVATRAWIGARMRTAARDLDPFARVAMLERATRLDPNDGEVDFELGVARLAIDEPERALVALQRSTPRFANVGTFVAIGNAQLALARTDAAIDAYSSAIRLDPGSFKAHADLAVALLDAGRLDDAETHARIALSLEPGVDRVRALLDRIAEAHMDAATN